MQVTLLPELQLGIVVLTNQETAAITAITNCIEDQYLGLGLTGPDCVQEVVDRMKARANGAGQATVAAYKQVALVQKAALKWPEYSAYTDRYHDAWLGDVVVVPQGTQLWLEAGQMSTPLAWPAAALLRQHLRAALERPQLQRRYLRGLHPRRAGPGGQRQNEADFVGYQLQLRLPGPGLAARAAGRFPGQLVAACTSTTVHRSRNYSRVQRGPIAL